MSLEFHFGEMLARSSQGTLWAKQNTPDLMSRETTSLSYLPKELYFPELILWGTLLDIPTSFLPVLMVSCWMSLCLTWGVLGTSKIDDFLQEFYDSAPLSHFSFSFSFKFHNTCLSTDRDRKRNTTGLVSHQVWGIWKSILQAHFNWTSARPHFCICTEDGLISRKYPWDSMQGC